MREMAARPARSRCCRRAAPRCGARGAGERRAVRGLRRRDSRGSPPAAVRAASAPLRAGARCAACAGERVAARADRRGGGLRRRRRALDPALQVSAPRLARDSTRRRSASSPRSSATRRARRPAPPPARVVPVPMHPRRLRERGFNPAGAARALRRARTRRPLRCAALLERVRDTASQTGLDRRARRATCAARSRVRRGRRVRASSGWSTTSSRPAARSPRPRRVAPGGRARSRGDLHRAHAGARELVHVAERAQALDRFLVGRAQRGRLGPRGP